MSVLLFTSVAIIGFVACTDDGGGDEGGGTSDGGSSSAGPICYDLDVSPGDGSSACGPTVCSGGTYCVGPGICDPGCRTTLECPANQYCDESTAGVDGVGLCKSPGADHEVPCGNGDGTCADRCASKMQECGAPPQIQSQGCAYICQRASNDQVDCIDEQSCDALNASVEQGNGVCGIELPAD